MKNGVKWLCSIRNLKPFWNGRNGIQNNTTNYDSEIWDAMDATWVDMGMEYTGLVTNMFYFGDVPKRIMLFSIVTVRRALFAVWHIIESVVTARKRSWGKVIFLHVSVILSTGWVWQADTPPSRQTPPMSGRHPPADTPWQKDTPPGQTPAPRQADSPIWAVTPPPRDGHCSRRYASYWNAYLFMFIIIFLAWFVQRLQWEAQDQSSHKGTWIQTSGWKTEGTTDRTSQPHGRLRPRQGQEKRFSGKFQTCTGSHSWRIHTCTGWLHTARHRNRYKHR